MKSTILAGAFALAFSGASFALPNLQLDINPGHYVGGSEETTIADQDQFTLRAFGSVGGKIKTTADLLATDLYISLAVIGPGGTSVGPAYANYGSFVFNGTTINVTNDMVYGNPPLESAIIHDAGDLAPHGIFPTFFAETEAWRFSAGDTTAAYNVADDSSAPGSMFFKDFTVDVGNLATGYAIHFDLYTAEARACGKKATTCVRDIDIGTSFAPFSHDAQSGHDRDTPSEVPEPTSLALLGLGALAAVRSARKR
jgi:hypothetical protein